MKYRIMTTDGEWLYGQIKVLENRLCVPLLDSQGHQVVRPDIILRKETLCKHSGLNDYYEDDLIACDDERWIVRSNQKVRGIKFPYEWYDLWDMDGEEVVGNLHENPELMK